MDEKDFCMEHSAHSVRLINLEADKKESWKSIDKAHERIDGMKNWVVAGMASLVIQLIGFIGFLVMAYLNMNIHIGGDW